MRWPLLLAGVCVVTGGVPFRLAPVVPDGWVAEPLEVGLPPDCATPDAHGLEYRVNCRAGEIQLTQTPEGAAVPVPKGLRARMELELGHVPDLRFVVEYPQGWLAFSDHGEWGGGIEWWDRSLDGAQRIEIGADDAPQNVVSAVTSGDRILVLQADSYVRNIGQLAELWREHDHFASHVIARYDVAPMGMWAQPDGSCLVLMADAVWRTLRTGTVQLIASLPWVPQYHTSLATDAAGRISLAGAVGVLQLTPSGDNGFRYDLLLPEGSDFERCWSRWLNEVGASKAP